MPKKKLNSIDELATFTQSEFLSVGKRFDAVENKVDRLEEKVDTGFKAIVDVLDLMRADLRDVKIALGPLVRTLASLEETVRHLDKRVARLEEQAVEK
jgi:polyhydroxyalkanoate synthesis regulator phasin